MQSFRTQQTPFPQQASDVAPASHTQVTVRIEALASLPVASEDVVVPPSPRVPGPVRRSSSRRWRAHILAEWEKYQAERTK